MKQKTMLALGSILCGLLLIAGGLGYTVSQASKYASNPVITGPDGETLNTFDFWSSDPSDQDEASGATDPWDLTGSGSNPSFENSGFFFTALSMLSGAVFAILGAIALTNRWQGNG